MKVTVIGFTEFKQAKSGNVGCWLHYAYDDSHCKGQAVDRCWVPVNVGLPQDLEPDEIIELSFNQNGRLTSCKRI